MKANIEQFYQAVSSPRKAVQITHKNKEAIMDNLLKEVTSLKDDCDIKPGDKYQIIVRKLDYYIQEYPQDLR